MSSRNMRPATRQTNRRVPAYTMACVCFALSLAGTPATVGAQAPVDRPYYANGEIHCPDGTSATFHSSGEPPTDAAMRVACAFKGSGEQTIERPANADQSIEKSTIAERLNSMMSAPRSPNGLPMEAVWERAPGAPDAEFTDARPYFVSRWGGIVIRGRRNGNLIDRALAARHCGASDNPATDIYFIGEAPANICEGVTQVDVGKTQSFTSPITIKGQESSYDKLGTPSGWVVLEFLQNIDGITHSGLKPATGDEAQSWGTSSLGAFYRNESGQHVFYAPGETVQLTKNFSFVVQPVMDPDEIAAKATAVIMDEMAKDPAIASIGRQKAETPWQWSFLVILGVPLALVGGAIFGAMRFLRRRREAHTTAPVNMSDAGIAAVANKVAPATPGPTESGNGVEEFFGMSRASANFRRQGWFTLLALAGPGLLLFSMLFWRESTEVTNFLELLHHFVVTKLLPLGLIGLGVAGAAANFHLGSKPETEVLWYRLDQAGLHILHDAVKRTTPSEMALKKDEAGALVTWASMKSLVVVPGTPSKVKIVRRPPGAVIDRTTTLFAGQRSRDGALFEDRVSLWFTVKSAGIHSPQVTRENPE